MKHHMRIPTLALALLTLALPMAGFATGQATPTPANVAADAPEQVFAQVITPEPTATAAGTAADIASWEFDLPSASATDSPTPPVATVGPMPKLEGTWQGRNAQGEVQLAIFGGELAILSYPGEDGVQTLAALVEPDADGYRLTRADGTPEANFRIATARTLTLQAGTWDTPLTLVCTSAQPATTGDEAAVLGTWGLETDDLYCEFTFGNGGVALVTVPSGDQFQESHLYVVVGQNIYTVQDQELHQVEYTLAMGNFLVAEYNDLMCFVRKPGALVRTVEPKSAAAAENRLLGTWGGTRDGLYSEWTFRVDGTFSCYCPQNEGTSIAGTYAQGEWLALKVLSYTLTVGYKINGDTLLLTFPWEEYSPYTRKPGPLTRQILTGHEPTPGDTDGDTPSEP